MPTDVWIHRLVHIATLSVLGTAGVARAQLVGVAFDSPQLDRWMYSFNQTPGAEVEATCFSPLLSPFQASFDNRDGECLVGFDTAASVPSGQAAANYRIRSATVTLRVSRDQAFTYDPTPDTFNTYLPSDPQYTPDADPGRPLEMFACGYRGGFSQSTFAQASAFGGPPGGFPARSVRNVFPAIYDANGALKDAANNVDDRFDARPIAVGRTQTNEFQPNAVAPGALVPVNTDMAFNLDLSNPDAIRYLRDGLASGRLNVLVTSLVITAQQSSAVPAFYTRAYEAAGAGDPAFVPARLSLSVCVGPPADWNCSGAAGVQDLFDFLAAWFAGNADFNSSGTTSVQDLFDFLAAWFGR